MKKCRIFVFGLSVGLLISITVAFAQQVMQATPNQFPVKFNGEEVNIRGYNIDGHTYFQLRDIGEQVGFNVDFKDGEILIDGINSKNTNIGNTQNGNIKNDADLFESVGHYNTSEKYPMGIDVFTDGSEYYYGLRGLSAISLKNCKVFIPKDGTTNYYMRDLNGNLLVEDIDIDYYGSLEIISETNYNKYILPYEGRTLEELGLPTMKK